MCGVLIMQTKSNLYNKPNRKYACRTPMWGWVGDFKIKEVVSEKNNYNKENI